MKRKIILGAVMAIIIALAAFIYFRFYFVFGEGVKAGDLNFVVYKGYVFKTYEYEFDFSIVDEMIADSLMHCGGKTVELHYKEYLGALPWRGKQKYIVDGIVSVR